MLQLDKKSAVPRSFRQELGLLKNAMTYESIVEFDVETLRRENRLCAGTFLTM